MRDPGLGARGCLCEAGIGLDPMALETLEDIVTAKKVQLRNSEVLIPVNHIEHEFASPVYPVIFCDVIIILI